MFVVERGAKYYYFFADYTGVTIIGTSNKRTVIGVPYIPIKLSKNNISNNKKTLCLSKEVCNNNKVVLNHNKVLKRQPRYSTNAPIL